MPKEPSDVEVWGEVEHDNETKLEGESGNKNRCCKESAHL
jgi:hypothetical protein